MIGGFVIIVMAIFAVAYIANRGRISADTGKQLTNTGFKTQKRSACITDLRNLSENYSGEVQDAVLNRLAVLDGYNPNTKKKIPLVMSQSGKLVPDSNIQKILAYEYVTDGLKARDKRKKVALLLTQPTLNKICGDPVVTKDDTSN